MDLSIIWKLRDLMSAPINRVVSAAQNATRAANSAAAAMSRGFSRTASSVNDLRAKLDSLKAYRDTLRIGIDTSRISAANVQLRNLQRQLDAVDKRNSRADGSGGSSGGMLMGLGRRFLPFMAASTVAATAGGFANSGMQRELVQSHYQQFAGEKQGVQTFEELNKFGNDTIYRNSDILKAGAKITEQFGANKALSQIKMYGNLAGGDAENLHGITRTMGQIKGVGRLQGDELNELANHGILGLQEKIASMKGVSVKMFYKMKEAGQISFDDVQKAMESMTGKGGKYFGYLDRMSATTFGRMQKFIGTVQDKFERLSMSNLGGLNSILDWANKFVDNWQPMLDAMSRFGKAFIPIFKAIQQLLIAIGLIPKQGDGVIETINRIASVFNVLASVVSFVANVVNNLVTGIRALTFGDTIVKALLLVGVFYKMRTAISLVTIQMTLMGAVTAMQSVISWFSLFAQIPFSAIFTGINGLKLVWLELNAVFAMTPIGAIIIAIVALVAAITLAWQHSETFREVMIRSWVAIEPAIMKVWEIVKGFFASLWDLGKEFYFLIILPVIDGFKLAYNKVVGIWDGLEAKTKDTFKRIGEIVATAIRVAVGVATFGLSEVALFAYKKFNKGYSSKEADKAVDTYERTKFLEKDRSGTQSVRDARRAARAARGANAMSAVQSSFNNVAGNNGSAKGTASGTTDTVEGAKSRVINITINKLVETINNYVDSNNTGRKVSDDVLDALNRILISGDRLAVE